MCKMSDWSFLLTKANLCKRAIGNVINLHHAGPYPAHTFDGVPSSEGSL